ncbi:hypothetical protein SLI_8086 [Streptomyces lividans 1326]|uniref:Uncharacterized protein n=1 Tax=Streptomyces lividans 1326 TaxID=1200984 RepID=A0A7U9DZ16_STRLI|nr:hypothetical protein SLI_8086 [Streptomyces lividans 1326]
MELDTERHRDGRRPAGGPVQGDAWRRVLRPAESGVPLSADPVGCHKSVGGMVSCT